MVDILVVRANKTRGWNIGIFPCTSVSQLCVLVAIIDLPNAPSVEGLARYEHVD